MAYRKITAAQAARSFSEILNRVKYRGESFIVERNRVPVCRIEPVGRRKPVTTDDFEAFWKRLPRPDAAFASDLDEAHDLLNELPRTAWEK